MQNKDYKEAALRTESNDFEAIQKRISSKRNIRLLHAGIGLATESGEFLDALKKAIFYGKELDRVNLQEEIGDLLWYCAIALDELGGVGSSSPVAGSHTNLVFTKTHCIF